MFVQNAWYVAAWDHEIERALKPRTILGVPLVFFRTEDGAVAALEDRCCHRNAPLSAGKLIGSEVQCGYHGLMFDRAGRCVEVPSQSMVPPGAEVRSWPVVERHRWVWVWMGDPAQADPAEIPDLFWHESSGWKAIGDYNHVNGAYQRMVDITLDQTHSQYVHPDTLGQADKVRARPKVSREGRVLRCERLMPDGPPPKLWAKVAGIEGNADSWNKWKYLPPSIVMFDVGIAKVGTGAFEGNRSQGVTGHNTHAFTPETEKTSHHFWVSARDFGLDNEELTQQFWNLRKVFREDVAMVEAVQRTVDAFPGAPTIDVNSDNPTIQARNMVARLIEDERRGVAA